MGDYVSQRVDKVCNACEGRGALLILPETSKNLPTTGVVVSMGEATTPEARRILHKVPLNYTIGDRILFGPYAGNMIPTKAGLLFKILDADNAWCKIEGAEDMAQFDFILQDDNAQ
jgi:co-chaperonin GroES (HSP10)